MAASKDGLFDENTKTKILDSKLLVVGAGGIGCELLKNLVLTGFKDIHLIDLDTIDVSNLNRQFLFQKRHIGQSKAVVAKESAQKFNPQASIIPHHKSILSSEFGVDFFQQFNAVTNALDNRTARSHVNRMCLAADIPLVESGSAGYLGQVTVHKKGITECYDCVPKGRQKAFAGCTIRNTPSEPIHCVVWAKHLFKKNCTKLRKEISCPKKGKKLCRLILYERPKDSQLFGEEDADEDVSPDTADPEARADPIEDNSLPTNESGNVQRISTREWAKSSNYDPAKLFQKLFYDDIQYLLTMDKLWEKRRKPISLDWMKLPDAVAGSSQQTSAAIKDQELWSIKECAAKFKDSLSFLKNKPEDQNLVWDKDDNYCMDFVASCANIRAYCFGIPQKSRFDVKSMAGNIIPAIATTNAIIAGLIVLQLIKLLRNQIDQCHTVYLNKQPNPKKKLLVPCQLVPPKSDCSICSPKPEVCIKMNAQTLTLKTLDEKILKEELCMIAPDVVIDDATGTILISSDGDTDDIKHKTLGDFGLTNGSRLKCEDFHQHCFFVITIAHCENLKDDVEFEVIGDKPSMQPEDDENMESSAGDPINDISVAIDVEDDDIIEEINLKRKSEDKSVSSMPAKKKSRSHATIVERGNDEL